MKQDRYIELAKNVAAQADHGEHFHGAVLVKGGKIINCSHNSVNFNKFAAHYVHLNDGRKKIHASLHAEIGCILGLPRKVTHKADVYVVRVRHTGELAMSKPCAMCEQVLRHVGVKRVFFSDDSGIICKMSI